MTNVKWKKKIYSEKLRLHYDHLLIYMYIYFVYISYVCIKKCICMFICLKWMLLQNSDAKTTFLIGGFDLIMKHISSLKMVRRSWKMTFHNQSLSLENNEWGFTWVTEVKYCALLTHTQIWNPRWSEKHENQAVSFIFPLAIELEKEKLPGSSHYRLLQSFNLETSEWSVRTLWARTPVIHRNRHSQMPCLTDQHCCIIIA